MRYIVFHTILCNLVVLCRYWYNKLTHFILLTNILWLKLRNQQQQGEYQRTGNIDVGHLDALWLDEICSTEWLSTMTLREGNVM